MNKKFNYIEFTKGFTLVELMVSVSIMAILMAVIIFNYGTFNDNLAISGAGQEMAIAIRQAQTYGLNVKESGVGSGSFNYSYGLYFDFDPDHNTEYYLFTDSNNNNKYDPGTGCGTVGTECIERVPLRNGVRISLLDATDPCPNSNLAKTLHLTFLRPNPDARINFANSGGNLICNNMNNATITLISPKSRTLVITVDRTGQVSVQ